MGDEAIRIEGLRKVYAARRGESAKEALSGIDLEIPQGSIFGLLGPNGAGKSTLINILAGLVVKTEGQVTIWGFDQDINPRQSRAAIGVMPQELNMDPFFTPRGALDVQAGLYGVPKSERRTDEILEMIGLTDKAEAYARTLSGGMQRRLLLGKALVHRPQILVLDEPTAGVDIELRQMLWKNVRQLNADGMTIILTTHYLEEAEEMCDEIAIIDSGRVLVRDKTRNLVNRMDSKTLVIEPASAVPQSLPLPDGVSMEQRAGGLLAFTYARSATSPDAILAALRDAGVGISDVSIEQPNLEDVFLQMTRAAR
ncbi:ABC transporter ATP-binding protein [Profundibacterium mesophilum]|nr:ABC transporter ATP-binding protein [Profundibacterium mesophilum]